MKTLTMQLSLSFKVIGAVLLISLFFFLPVAYVNIEHSREMLEAAYVEKAKTIARLLDANIRNRAALSDATRLFAHIQKNIWLDPDIISIDINLPDQGSLMTFVSSENERTGRPADADNVDSYTKDMLINKIIEKDNQRYLRVVTPIHIAKQQAGTYQIELTLEHVESQIRAALQVSILSYFVMILLFVLLLFWVLRIIMIRPVREMNRGVETIAKGDLDWRVTIKSKDEIGELAAAFNRMTGDLKESHRKLDERRMVLEQEVDERRAVEKKLRESEKKIRQQNELFKTVIESLTHPFYVIDLKDYTVKIANSAANTLGDLPENLTCYALTHNNNKLCDSTEHSCPVKTVKRTKRPATVEHIHYDTDGNPRNVEVHAYPIFDDEGNVAQMIEYSLDVTERKQAEKALRKAHDQLERRVEERTVELVKTNEQLKREIEERKRTEEELKQTYHELKDTQAQLIQSAKLASIGELAAGVAHELNQPLMVIRLNAQLLLRNLRKNASGSDERMKQLEPIERNTKRMMNIINHLRTFSRQAQTGFSPQDVNKIIEGAFLMLGEQLRLHNIEVKNNLSPNLPTVLGNANQIEQVFLNLLANARDAMEAKGEDAPGTIEIVTRVSGENNEWVEVLIKDSGTGIAAEHLEKIFDPFFTSKEIGKGTGLGLSISYGIIQDHHGDIEVLETSSEGTTFRIRLPILIDE